MSISYRAIAVLGTVEPTDVANERWKATEDDRCHECGTRRQRDYRHCSECVAVQLERPDVWTWWGRRIGADAGAVESSEWLHGPTDYPARLVIGVVLGEVQQHYRSPSGLDHCTELPAPTELQRRTAMQLAQAVTTGAEPRVYLMLIAN